MSLKRYARVPQGDRDSWPDWLWKPCAGHCGRPWASGQRVRIDEKAGVYVKDKRFTTYHAECTPEELERRVRRIVSHRELTGSWF